jgi:hypothetical protein
VDIYNRVRRAWLKDGMSAREAARYFNKDRKTIAKMLHHDLTTDVNNVFHAFLQQHKLLSGTPKTSLSNIQVITPFNIPQQT